MRSTDKFIHVDSIFTAFSVKRESNFNFFGESHNFWEMVYVTRGTVGIMAGSKIYHLNKNEVIFHKPYEFHRIWSAKDSSPEYLVVSFDLSGTGIGFFENLTLKPNDIQKKLLNTLMIYTKENKPRENNSLDYAGKDGSDFSCFVYLLDLILCSFAKSSELILESKSENAMIFEKVVKYMESNLDKNITIEEFSKYANVSPSTLKRVFLKYSSIGIHGYFQTLKIQEAKNMLKSGMSVYNVSKSLGFSNQNNFSLTFKKAVGFSPTEYKKLHNY